jgi:hypothetical protein
MKLPIVALLEEGGFHSSRLSLAILQSMWVSSVLASNVYLQVRRRIISRRRRNDAK